MLSLSLSLSLSLCMGTRGVPPSDASKILPGVCGCGVADVDTNGNGVMDCVEDGTQILYDVDDECFVDEDGGAWRSMVGEPVVGCGLPRP